MSRARMFLGLVVGAALLCVGCKKDDKALVQCQVAEHAIVCSVAHQQGEDAVNVTWNVTMRCQNGVTATAHGAKMDLRPSGQSTVVLPEAEIENLPQCNQIVGVSVDNITVTHAGT